MSISAFADRVVGLFVPKVEAAALWYTQCACVADAVFSKSRYTRQVHDGSGYCTPWTAANQCCGPAAVASCYSYLAPC
jgi:hypothetical protein